MKKQLLSFILSLSIFSVLISCTKSPSSNTSNTDAMTFMKAHVQSNKVTPAFDTISWASDLTLGTQFDTVVNITGTKSSNSHTGRAGQAIGFKFMKYAPSAGTYTIDGKNISAYWMNNGSSVQIPATSGTITLDTATNQRAAGSFSFTTSDSTVISNGTFSLSW